MPVLQINQQPGSASNRYRISVQATEIPDRAALSFDTDIEFELTPENAERIRWYLEDYLQFDEDPAPQIAKGVEAFMVQCGEQLFRGIFDASPAAIKLWSSLEPHLTKTRIEVATGITEATAIPWELIRDPNARTFLALSAEAFVRNQYGGQTVLPPAGEAAKVRILLVICRPKGGKDVPFRSVAGKLVTRLSDDARDAFDIDVLRPPTYEQLATKLHLAKERGQPYHIVHFDGHGVYAEPTNLAIVGKVLSSLKLGAGNTGAHGFLMFEDPDSETNGEFVDGFRLGGLLRDASVPVLVLNACQSAFVEARPQPATEKPTDTRKEIEAYGSLAQAVMDAGAAGVVAMRYSVYVVTAAQFVTELYGALARGRTLGEAVTWARKNLHDQSDRQIAYDARPLQDWLVPVVWERSPIRLWPEKLDAVPLKLSLEDAAASKPGAVDQALPPRPDVGFYGRDETLYALDRAFDTHRIVLMHAYAGSGKTSTAAEFARWYALTGGVEGPVLFSTFERHLPLARVLDKIGVVFGDDMRRSGIEWDAITDPEQRRHIVFQVLQQVPVLWIWDNVEPVTGFPAGTPSDWTTAEQQELLAFLRAARDTSRAKFLLTSRRDESAWLGELALRVEVPAMPMQERLQLAGAIVAQRGKRLAALPDLTPLLRFTRGNPLSILVTVGEALRASIGSKERLETFVASLRSGEVEFEDEETEGRSKSLGASLSYGFARAFAEDERKILALLHLFQGFVNVEALRGMGHPGDKWCVDVVRGLTRERGISLLDRAAEIGLLIAHGHGYYGIHPALPWYFRALFERFFPGAEDDINGVRRSFAEAIGRLSDFYFRRYFGGHNEALSAIAAEEDNLLVARSLACKLGCWKAIIGTMQGLRTLYDSTGRSAAMRRLVNEVIPLFVDPATDGPLPGLEEEWTILTDNRVSIARQERRWEEAERLQTLCVNLDRQRAQSLLAGEPERWSALERNNIRSFAASLHGLAQIQRDRKSAACAQSYLEALEVASAIKDTDGLAICAFNLGRVYTEIPDLRNLDEAERWCRQSLELRAPGDLLAQGQCLAQLGSVAIERFDEAEKANRPMDELIKHLTEAVQLYEQSLTMIPEGDVSRGISHNQLGSVLARTGDTSRALHHYRQAVRYAEEADNYFSAGTRRYNIALTLYRAGRLSEARAYATAALANFGTFGKGAAAEIEQADRLIANIDQTIETGGGT